MKLDFDRGYEPPINATLPSVVADQVRAVREDRLAKGLLVQFVREDGTLDEWSFRDEARRDEFISGLTARGVDFATP